METITIEVTIGDSDNIYAARQAVLNEVIGSLDSLDESEWKRSHDIVVEIIDVKLK